MKNLLVIPLLSCSLLLGACGEDDPEIPKADTPSVDVREGSEVEDPVVHMAAEGVRREIGEIYDEYLDIKDALVKSDAEAARNNARELVNELKFDTNPLTVEEGQKWTNMMQSLQNTANAIATAPALAQQRESFAMLSSTMENTIRSFGLADKTVYRQYCPMAFDNKGGYWLASEEEINNPYFGDEMLHCGAVEDTLTF